MPANLAGLTVKEDAPMSAAVLRALQRKLGELSELPPSVEAIERADRLQTEAQVALMTAKAHITADLHYLAGQSIRELADRLGVSQTSTWKWLRRYGPEFYVTVVETGDGRHRVEAVPIESQPQIRELRTAGRRFVPATWGVEPATADADGLWERIGAQD